MGANSGTSQSIEESCQSLRERLAAADAVIIGAGAGLSTSAGLTYSGARFERYFGDFRRRYGFRDMYSGGFYPYDSPEQHWAYWSRYVHINRYVDAPKPVYRQLLSLVQGRDYFVLTTNVDHQFQRAGFDKTRLFYTQGDYGLFQCAEPCHAQTYDNREAIREMVEAQGYSVAGDGALVPPEGVAPQMAIPSGLIPRCPKCGRPMRMNLRADDTFVEDEGWHAAAKRYGDFLRGHEKGRVLFLELGVGYNTPGIIKFPFWRMTYQWLYAAYACVNRDGADAPKEIASRAVCTDADIGIVLARLSCLGKARSGA